MNILIMFVNWWSTTNASILDLHDYSAQIICMCDFLANSIMILVKAHLISDWDFKTVSKCNADILLIQISDIILYY